MIKAGYLAMTFDLRALSNSTKWTLSYKKPLKNMGKVSR